MQYASEEKICFADIGAGSLEAQEALIYFKLKGTVVAVYDFPEKVFPRARQNRFYWRNRTLNEFKNVEYSKARMRIYETAKYCIDITGLSEQEAIRKFLDFVNVLRSSTRPAW